MFGPNIKARNFKHRQLPSTTIPPSLGQNATYSASGTVIELDASIDGGQTFNHLRAPADVTVAMHHTVDAGPARFFDTEILALDIRGGDLPPQVMLRESPTLASTGEHIIRPAPRGVGFSINSYFDVALELSTDGGQTWTPASGPVHLDVAGPPLLAIPTLSEWGLIILALLLLTVIALFLRRPREMAMAEAGGPRC